MVVCQLLHLRQIPGGVFSEWYHLTEHTDSMCNDNVLINTDFTHPVNQHGQMEYATLGNRRVYTIDMWSFANGHNDNGTTITVGSNGITITNDGNVFVWEQMLEPVRLKLGETYTLSVELHDGTIKTLSCVVEKFMDSPEIVLAENCFADMYNYQAGDGLFSVRILGTMNGSITIKSIKLELGTVSTLKNEVVNYAEQIWRCQRYFYKLEWSRIPMRRHTDGKFYGSVSVGIRMRLAPSVKVIKFGIMDVNGTDIQIEDISVERISGNDIDIVAAVNNTSIPARCIAMLLDAELYFSAEL